MNVSAILRGFRQDPRSHCSAPASRAGFGVDGAHAPPSGLSPTAAPGPHMSGSSHALLPSLRATQVAWLGDTL